MKIIYSLASLMLMGALISWLGPYWHYVCDAGVLALTLTYMAFTCPWVGIVGFVIWWVRDDFKKDKAKREKEEEQHRLLVEKLRRFDAIQASMEMQVQKLSRKHAENQGTAGPVWGRN